MTHQPITPQQALAKAADLCSRSEQAETDIRTKLKTWGIKPGDANAIIARLKEENYMNAERYVHAFVRDRFRFAGWGKVKIAYQLKLKKFDQALIEGALEEIDAKEYEKLILRLLSQKLLSLKGKDFRSIKASLLRFAVSRGFEVPLAYNYVAKVMAHVPTDGCDDEPDDAFYPDNDNDGY